jgi:hypothetical protein
VKTTRNWLISGCAVAIMRLIIFRWVAQSYTSHAVSITTQFLEWVLYPELFVVTHTQVSGIRDQLIYYTVFSLFLVLGSFVITTPVLLLRRTPKSK